MALFLSIAGLVLAAYGLAGDQPAAGGAMVLAALSLAASEMDRWAAKEAR